MFDQHYFDSRRDFSQLRLIELRNEIESRVETAPLEHALVYVTGLVARGEASTHSDVDLFIVDVAEEREGEIPLSKLDATIFKADLIRATSTVGFPAFSGDGIYLEVHALTDLVRRIGRRDDDFYNSFTARLLLLLESRPVFNDKAHKVATDLVVDSYWRDYEDNDNAFTPVFLANDIVRYWKTVALNYEAQRFSGVPTGLDRAEWKNRNRLKNIKLKFSRLWTCHSALAFLLWKTADGRSMTPEDAGELLQLSPFDRMIQIRTAGFAASHIDRALSLYEWFLKATDAGRDASLDWVGSRDNWIEARANGAQFGEAVSKVLKAFEDESALYRYLLV